MAHANASFNDRIDAQLQLHPRLGVHSKLHSHPFSADPFLSSGDMHHGVNSAKARRWRERRGLGTALLHVVYPDGEPAPDERPWRLGAEGAVSGGRDGQPKVYWRVRTWGSLPGGEMRDLGDARVVPQRNPLVRSARKPPYWTTRRGRRWCDAQKAALRQAGYPLVSRNMLGRGWRRYIVGDGRRAILLALPPDLPRMAPRVLEIIDAAADNFQLLPLPRHMAEARTLKMTSLSAIAAYYLGLNHATG